MASNFSSLRSSRKSLLDKLTEEVKKDSQKGGQDDRFWKLSVDQKTGIGYAVLRFLPAPKNEEIPWVRVFSHAFQGEGGGWFIENCPTTLGNRPCPVCKSNNKLWNSGIDANKNVARDRKRKLQFISNVLVVSDPAHPENEGKVFLFKYGKKIHDKIMELIEPQFPDQTPTNPFDMWEGADFKLKAAKKDGYQNYDRSEWCAAAELLPGDDEAKESLWDSEHSLTQFVAEKEFKSYEELEARFTKVMSDSPDAPATAEDAMKQTKSPSPKEAMEAAKAAAAAEEEEDKKPKRPTPKSIPGAKPKVAAKKEPEPEATVEDDEIQNFFKGFGEDE